MMVEQKFMQVGMKVTYNNGEVDSFVFLGNFETYKKYMVDLAKDEQVIKVEISYKN